MVHGERMTDGKLRLRYHIDASRHDLMLPAPAIAARTDSLWQTTCLEMFGRMPGETGYCEFNFSPSTLWAAYRFESYRAGMAELLLETPPEIAVDACDTHVVLEARVAVPAPWRLRDIELGLSAVIESADGTISYWALAHPLGAADFHHAAGFALTLPMLEQV